MPCWGSYWAAGAPDFVGDVLSAIFRFEVNDGQPRKTNTFFALIFLLIVMAATWFALRQA